MSEYLILKNTFNHEYSCIITKQKLTAKKLAEEIGISKSMVSHIENVRHNPSWDVAKRLEEYFNLPAKELLAVTEEDLESNLT